jgi:hypothetical protein
MFAATFVVHTRVAIVDTVLNNFVIGVYKVFFDIVGPSARGLSAVHHTSQAKRATLSATFGRIRESGESVVPLEARGIVRSFELSKLVEFFGTLNSRKIEDGRVFSV